MRGRGEEGPLFALESTVRGPYVPSLGAGLSSREIARQVDVEERSSLRVERGPRCLLDGGHTQPVEQRANARSS